MRLLKTSLTDPWMFSDEDTSGYAILSHTWGDSEVTFPDAQSSLRSEYNNASYDKIERCCKQAALDGFEHVWIDTCCMDKTSSTELSEAINSMFHLYINSQVCYVFLSDVPSDEDPRKGNSAFRRSRWFTRGWTLQELLAPLSLVFFSLDWVEIGTKSTLCRELSEITGIPIRALLGPDGENFSVAQRMSWASKRETKRPEDMAYCLMGIFGINMPMLYGEGEKAFLRLQLEILKISDDHSIFSWVAKLRIPRATRGPLAYSPAEFADCGNVCQHLSSPEHSPFAMTNKGLHIKLRLYREPRHSLGDGLFLLDCYNNEDGGTESARLGIFLLKFPGGQNQGISTWARVFPHKISKIRDSDKFVEQTSNITELYIHKRERQSFDIAAITPVWASYQFSITKVPPSTLGFSLDRLYPVDLWAREEGREILKIKDLNTSGAIMFANKSGDSFAVLLGVDLCCIWSHVMINVTNSDVEQFSEKKGREMRDIVQQRSDRITEPLPRGGSVHVSVKKGRREFTDNGETRHNFVEISII